MRKLFSKYFKSFTQNNTVKEGQILKDEGAWGSLHSLMSNSNREWAKVFLIVSLIVLMFWVLVHNQLQFIIGIDIFIFLLGLALVFLAFCVVLDKQMDRIEKRIRDTEIELQATHRIGKFMHLPLNLGGWAITAHFLDRLTREVYSRKPNLIVECGSGTSTIVISSCLKDLGNGLLISLDHKHEYANKTKKILEQENLSKWANVISAPLIEYELDSRKFWWYESKFLGELNTKIDMLIVDGPPGKLNQSRYPAVPVLKNFLADECMIMLDDGNRVDEKKIAHKWASLLNADLEYNEQHRGYSIINRRLT